MAANRGAFFIGGSLQIHPPAGLGSPDTQDGLRGSCHCFDDIQMTASAITSIVFPSSNCHVPDAILGLSNACFIFRCHLRQLFFARNFFKSPAL
ncbi:hypothetical protein D3C84_1109670 [compost metagenome]